MKKLLTILFVFLTLSLPGQTIPRDKQLHIAAGTEIGFISSVLTVEKKPLVSFVWAVGSATVIGVTKELGYDKMLGKGTPEIKDAAWTVIGGVAGYLIVQGFKFIGNKLEALIRKKTLPRLTCQK